MRACERVFVQPHMDPQLVVSRFTDCKEAGRSFGFPRGRCGIGKAYGLEERKAAASAITVLSPSWSENVAVVADDWIIGFR